MPLLRDADWYLFVGYHGKSCSVPQVHNKWSWKCSANNWWAMMIYDEHVWWAADEQWWSYSFMPRVDLDQLFVCKWLSVLLLYMRHKVICVGFSNQDAFSIEYNMYKFKSSVSMWAEVVSTTSLLYCNFFYIWMVIYQYMDIGKHNIPIICAHDTVKTKIFYVYIKCS